MRSTSYTKQTANGTSGQSNAFGHWSTSLWRTLRQRARDRATVRALESLSDHGLKDIGLHRSEITSAVRSKGNDRWPRGRWQ